MLPSAQRRHAALLPTPPRADTFLRLGTGAAVQHAEPKAFFSAEPCDFSATVSANTVSANTVSANIVSALSGTARSGTAPNDFK